MVVCNMEIPRPPPPPSFNLNNLSMNLMSLKGIEGHGGDSGSVRSRKSSESQGFRLLDNNQDDTGSVYSIYKQKIDSMFESDSSTGNVKNSVQARIEKMFTDVAKDSGIAITKEIGSHVFSVDYMGSVPLQNKVANLRGLQEPLKELYFAYKKRNASRKKPLTGRLEISPTGLKVQYQGEKGDLEQLNSFPTIAVWSAVKFVLHDDDPSRQKSFAFLPLITDPDNIDKQTLFRNLEQDDQKFIDAETHSPLFAVVMRKIGAHKQLECHGFICQTSEDAIVVAATLYKSLMAHMKSKRPKNKNGVTTCLSVTSSAINDNGSSNMTPVRPPRKKRSTSSSGGSEKDNSKNSHESSPAIETHVKKSSKSKKAPKVPNQNLDEILTCEEKEEKEKPPTPLGDKWNTLMTTNQKQITAEIKQVISEGSHRGLQGLIELAEKNEEEKKFGNENGGDILTKVTIPRSGSFLNAGGLTRYKSKMNRGNGQATGGSPLGFHELFNEFRLQEGLHSVDEILGVIIDPEGMSFNDLKPIYKEFLLKLALTLTKDELYQRSKAIMRRQKKKLLRRNSQARRKNIVVNQRFKSLKHIFRKTLKAKLSKTVKPKVATLPKKLPESSISTSSYDTRQFNPKDPKTEVARKPSYKKKVGEVKKLSRERTSTSEDSDFFSLRKMKNAQQPNQNRNSSSGYVSCSECSYDSDTCTCTSADKCYCSLGQKKNAKAIASCRASCNTEEKCYCTLQTLQGSLSYCGCDTDSCTESNKCYCPKGERTSTLQLLALQQGFIPHRRLCKNNSNSKSTQSLEYVPNPAEKYYEKLWAKQLQRAYARQRSFSTDNLALDYELFTIADRNLRRYYGRSRERTTHSLMCKQSVRSLMNGAKYSGRREVLTGRTLRSTSISAGACTEALSVKKSAEIAALFADIKLSQTTDITNLLPSHDYRHPWKQLEGKLAKGQKFDPKGHKFDPKGYRVDSKTPLQVSKNPLYVPSKSMGKSKLYSTRNGLYTIQSQSDDSRRSSVCEPRKDKREFYPLDSQVDNTIGSNIENTLGYLP